MSFELFIGLRYLKAKRKSTFISLITLISVAGVALGVMALIIVLAVTGLVASAAWTIGSHLSGLLQ